MNLEDIAGYMSQYQGTEVDDAVGRIRGIDRELAKKVDKSQKINGYSLDGDIDLKAQDVGALSDTIKYGSSIVADGNVISLKDQNGSTISSTIVNASPLVDGTTIIYKNGALAVNTTTLVVENVDGGQLTINGN